MLISLLKNNSSIRGNSATFKCLCGVLPQFSKNNDRLIVVDAVQVLVRSCTVILMQSSRLIQTFLRMNFKTYR